MPININLNDVENSTNKGETVVGNESSTTKYLSIKGVYDWAVGLFQTKIMERIAGSTYSTVQHAQDIFNSAGWISGGVITDAGGGVITITSGTGLIRATDSDVATIYFTDFAASSPANVVLVDGTESYIYVEYNGGTPRVVSTTIMRTDYNTNFRIGNVFRSGTELHINQTDKIAITDHAGKIIRFNQEVMPYANVSGGMLGEVGVRQITVSAGEFWMGLVKFATTNFDSSMGSVFNYWYYNGATWVNVSPTSNTIDNTQYNNIATGLATLSNNRYGVHWIYQSMDDDVNVIFGQGNYTLVEAENAQPPATIPIQVSSGSWICGKIIIKKNAATFTQVESALSMGFTGSIATDHENLLGLLGGAANDHYHLTAAQLTNLDNQSGTNTGDNTVISGTTTFDFGNENDGVVETISNASITTTNFLALTVIPTETTATSLDDFKLNGVTFSIENIINNTSFDIRATANNNATGIYTINYKIILN